MTKTRDKTLVEEWQDMSAIIAYIARVAWDHELVKKEWAHRLEAIAKEARSKGKAVEVL